MDTGTWLPGYNVGFYRGPPHACAQLNSSLQCHIKFLNKKEMQTHAPIMEIEDLVVT